MCSSRGDSTGHVQRGEFPYNLPATLRPKVGQLIPHSGTAKNFIGVACGLAEPMGALQNVLDSAFLQIS
jgi:hypothetical protein